MEHRRSRIVFAALGFAAFALAACSKEQLGATPSSSKGRISYGARTVPLSAVRADGLKDDARLVAAGVTAGALQMEPAKSEEERK
jgi:hypothetical protein